MSSQWSVPSHLYSRSGYPYTSHNMQVSDITLISPKSCKLICYSRYYHRTLNVTKLVNVNFTYIPRSMTLARMIRIYNLPSNLHLASSIREMEEKDAEGVHALYTKYMQRFDLVPTMTVEEVRHQFLSGRGTGEKKENSRRQGQVVWTYVVEVCSLYTLDKFMADYVIHRTPNRIKLQTFSRSIRCLQPSSNIPITTS